MDERVAREVMLVRAIETTDRDHDILSQDDRRHASRSARELAHWQASETGKPVTAEQFLQQRAAQVLQRLGERTPAFAGFPRHSGGLGRSGRLLPLAALVCGALLDRIGDPHRVDLLSAPLLLIIGWNLLVYGAMLFWRIVPKRGRRRSRWFDGSLAKRLLAGGARLPRKLPRVLSQALVSFLADWTRMSQPLTTARLATMVHLSAACFAAGALLSLYARGFLSQYAAGWESTFLDAAQLESILSVVFAPAHAVFRLPGFTLADIESLRYAAPARSGLPAAGAHWVHLYAATLFLLVILPRLLLSAFAHRKARRLAACFPLPLDEPYFRRLTAAIGGKPGVLRVLPYSFTLDEARDKGLAALAEMLLGEQTRLMLRPSSAYGDDPGSVLRDTILNDPDVKTTTAVLFSLAATPETENHGAFLRHLKHALPSAPTVLVDESGYLERLGGQAGSTDRITQRIALWQEFCRFHDLTATIVNLRDPAARPPDHS